MSTYSGQTSVVIGGVAWLLFEAALSLLIILGIVEALEVIYTENGYDWYAADKAVEAIKADSELRKYYNPANVKGTMTYIALYAPTDKNGGMALVTSDILDVYSYTASMAYDVIRDAGFLLEKSTPDHHTNSKGMQFKHYHKIGHMYGDSKLHSLFGIPTIVK